MLCIKYRNFKHFEIVYSTSLEKCLINNYLKYRGIKSVNILLIILFQYLIGRSFYILHQFKQKKRKNKNINYQIHYKLLTLSIDNSVKGLPLVSTEHKIFHELGKPVFTALCSLNISDKLEQCFKTPRWFYFLVSK